MLKTVFVRSLFVCCHKYTKTFPLYTNVELTPKNPYNTYNPRRMADFAR